MQRAGDHALAEIDLEGVVLARLRAGECRFRNTAGAKVFFSDEVRLPKPEPKVFEAALGALGVSVPFETSMWVAPVRSTRCRESSSRSVHT